MVESRKEKSLHYLQVIDPDSQQDQLWGTRITNEEETTKLFYSRVSQTETHSVTEQ